MQRKLAQPNAGITAKADLADVCECRGQLDQAQARFVGHHIQIKLHRRVKPDLRHRVRCKLPLAGGAGLAVDGVVRLGALD